MAIPAAVQTQLSALNVAVNKLLIDRDRIINIFEDGLGASAYSLFSTSNQTAFKNAVTADMTAADQAIQSVISALAGL